MPLETITQLDQHLKVYMLKNPLPDNIWLCLADPPVFSQSSITVVVKARGMALGLQGCVDRAHGECYRRLKELISGYLHPHSALNRFRAG